MLAFFMPEISTNAPHTPNVAGDRLLPMQGVSEHLIPHS